MTTIFDPGAFRRFRVRRAKRSLRRFAEPLGYTGQMIEAIEARRAMPSLGLLHAVSEQYGADLRQFFVPCRPRGARRKAR